MQAPPPGGFPGLQPMQQPPPPPQMWNPAADPNETIKLQQQQQQQQQQHPPMPLMSMRFDINDKPEDGNIVADGIIDSDDGNIENSTQSIVDVNDEQFKKTNLNDDNGDGDDDANRDGDGDVDNDATGKKPTEVVLPKVLEDVLALKDQRAAEFDINADDFIQRDDDDIGGDDGNNVTHSSVIVNDYDVGDDSDDDTGTQVNGLSNKKSGQQSKAEKNKRKKKRKKLNKKLRQQQQQLRELDRSLESNGIEPIENVIHDKDDEEKEEVEENIEEQPEEKEKVHKEKSREKSRDKDKEKEKEKREKHRSRKRDKDDEREKEKEKEQEKEKVSEEQEDVSIEYVAEKLTIADLAPMHRQFYRVFEIFKFENKPKLADKDKDAVSGAIDGSGAQKKLSDKMLDDDEDDIEDDDHNKDEKEKLSKRKLKKLTRLSVAELKQLVSRPDVVEMHDVTARDPKLLVQLKAYRNTVQVPRHWCFKRKYLQGKRGIEKPPFDLPAFIKKTGIMEMRESLQEKDEAKSLKSKMRERVRPKMGKIDIDYQKLHDAFFKWQTKPRMTIHGDLYYEGKEFETRLKEKKPGDLSEELRIALGMPVGPNAHKIPPPWLIAQQRYGPPPSYPNLKIPGLNAPIPDGTSFGYHAGGWGKPPVDESGKPLYGDVFGTNLMDLDNGIDEADIERNQWGELESESEESSEEEEDDGEDMINQPDESGLVTPAEGLVTPSGLTSVPGLETPENIELRKKKIEAEMEDNETPVLYQVLPEKRTDRVGASMMGSTHVYDITGVNKPATVRAPGGSGAAGAAAGGEGTVELALDPSELDLDNEAMAQRYEQQMREQQSHLQKEDLSDMLAEHVARQKSKRKRAQGGTTGTGGDASKSTKKYKEFKF